MIVQTVADISLECVLASHGQKMFEESNSLAIELGRLLGSQQRARRLQFLQIADCRLELVVICFRFPEFMFPVMLPKQTLMRSKKESLIRCSRKQIESHSHAPT